MKTHTPGEWTVGQTFTNDGGKPIMAMVNGERTRIAVVDSVIERTRKTPYDAPDEERDANIRLICAAPELLAACECALAEFNGRPAEHMPATRAQFDMLTAAIAKAKGEQ